MSELKRHMGLFHLTMYGVGLILGAGIYVLIGEAAGFAGNSMWISFLLGAIVAVFAGLSYSELSALYPKAAAEYTFVKNAFKNHFFGRRYPGVYADMAWSRIEWAEEKGLDVEEFKDMRSELLPTWLRAECSNNKVDINKHAAIFAHTGTPFRGEHFLHG